MHVLLARSTCMCYLCVASKFAPPRGVTNAIGNVVHSMREGVAYSVRDGVAYSVRDGVAYSVRKGVT